LAIVVAAVAMVVAVLGRVVAAMVMVVVVVVWWLAECSVGVIKNAPSRKKCAKLCRFLAVVYNVVISFFLFFSGLEKSRFVCGRIYFYTQHTVATTKGHEVTDFFKSGFFLQDASPK
jgi:Cu/Ag efflux pump CusA